MQCELIAKGDRRASSLPDLMIAATTERHQATVLHYDGDYDMITAVTGLAAKWVVPSGSADYGRTLEVPDQVPDHDHERNPAENTASGQEDHASQTAGAG